LRSLRLGLRLWRRPLRPVDLVVVGDTLGATGAGAGVVPVAVVGACAASSSAGVVRIVMAEFPDSPAENRTDMLPMVAKWSRNAICRVAWCQFTTTSGSKFW
jgi:hypothetical protein